MIKHRFSPKFCPKWESVYLALNWKKCSSLLIISPWESSFSRLRFLSSRVGNFVQDNLLLFGLNCSFIQNWDILSLLILLFLFLLFLHFDVFSSVHDYGLDITYLVFDIEEYLHKSFLILCQYWFGLVTMLFRMCRVLRHGLIQEC